MTSMLTLWTIDFPQTMGYQWAACHYNPVVIHSYPTKPPFFFSQNHPFHSLSPWSNHWVYNALRSQPFLTFLLSIVNHGFSQAMGLIISCKVQWLTILNHSEAWTSINKNGWLVVGPPLWKIWKSLGMMTFPIYGKIKHGNQTTNQMEVSDAFRSHGGGPSHHPARVPPWFAIPVDSALLSDP